ncbi:hypothetical protein AVEN_110667-1 [Araneus ventricosus]|uniref:Transposase Tc1-like domain-containing protein n=1 Tax=Araneus ventricosus TaxID=182803 RepID=A0A4Y2AWV2_ARAVE|nr:hypothetical protein AVEN_110667-1 [Araneus ventricosus]
MAAANLFQCSNLSMSRLVSARSPTSESALCRKLHRLELFRLISRRRSLLTAAKKLKRLQWIETYSHWTLQMAGSVYHGDTNYSSDCIPITHFPTSS